MTMQIVVHPEFDRVWPFAADFIYDISKESEDAVEFSRLTRDDSQSIGEVLTDGEDVSRLISLGVPVTDDCLDKLSSLQEASIVTPDSMYSVNESIAAELEERGVRVHDHVSHDFWGQSVAEFALGLTISALRRLPHRHNQIITDQDPWDFDPGARPQPGSRGHQFADDPRFTNGTIANKNVRIVGLGNIGSRYADIVSTLGADVTAHDPFADEPCFHRSGARKTGELDELVSDADIFAPMVPLNEKTRRIITSDLIEQLPRGCLVVLVTRAQVCDMKAIRRRVLNNELALAADVWDDGKEPLPLDDPILNRSNVVHTPHIAGRTRDANRKWAEYLVSQFDSIDTT